MVSTQEPSIDVRHGRSLSHMCFRPDGLLHLDRVVQTPVPVDVIDAYGGFWFFGVTTASMNHIAFEYENRRYDITGNYGVFVPPFAVVKWYINPGRLRFHAYIGNERFARKHGLDKPMLIPMDNPEKIVELSEIEAVLLKAKQDCELPVTESHSVVQKAKHAIDCTYLDICNITNIANQIGVEPATLSRLFKRRFGIPPIAYRNKLRVFYAKYRLATSDVSVSAAGFDSGFEDLSSFNRQFKKIIGTVPSQFKIRE